MKNLKLVLFGIKPKPKQSIKPCGIHHIVISCSWERAFISNDMNKFTVPKIYVQ